jgi:hypothetical protein
MMTITYQVSNNLTGQELTRTQVYRVNYDPTTGHIDRIAGWDENAGGGATQ